MVMDFILEQVSVEDGREIIDIFNHYVENNFAAFPESCLPYESFSLFLDMAKGYPFLVAKDGTGKVLGFGFLHPHNPIPAFLRLRRLLTS
jgi:L-amino acid N-acyltransferase YncA